MLAGVDIGAERAVKRLTSKTPILRTFGDAATDWLAARVNLSPKYREAIRARLDRYVLPALGKLPLAQITPEVAAALARAIASKGQTARWALQHVDQITCATPSRWAR